MTHPGEELLIEFVLDEGGEGRRAEIAAHLDACETCRTEFEELRRVLRATAEDPVPPRGLTYGAEVWARLEPRLRETEQPVRRLHAPGAGLFFPFRAPAWRRGSDGALDTAGAAARAPATRRRGWTAAAPWLAAAAAVLIVVSAFIAGRWSRTATGPQPAVATGRPAADPTTIRQRVVLAALSDHVERAERALLEISNASGSSATVDISAERAWARDLLDANRLYRQSARTGASPALSELLDDIEPILLDIVHSPSHITGDELRAMQARIDARALVFKLRVSAAEMRARQTRRIHAGEPTS